MPNISLFPKSEREAYFLARLGRIAFFLTLMPLIFGNATFFGKGVFCVDNQNFFSCLLSIDPRNPDVWLAIALMIFYCVAERTKKSFLLGLIVTGNAIIFIYSGAYSSGNEVLVNFAFICSFFGLLANGYFKQETQIG